MEEIFESHQICGDSFLYACGGFYSDMDNFVVKHFPNDDWVVCSGEDGFLNIGFIKCTQKNSIFFECIKKLKIDWGGVQVFTDAYRNYLKTSNQLMSQNYFILIIGRML